MTMTTTTLPALIHRLTAPPPGDVATDIPYNVDCTTVAFADHNDPACRERTGWQILPKSPEEVAWILKNAAQCSGRLSLSKADAAYLDQPMWLDLSGLHRIVRESPEDHTIQVETGITAEALQKHLAAHNLAWPLAFPPDTRLVDILAEDATALNTGNRGLPRDWVLGLQVADSDGQLTRCGGNVVKNVSGYDLNKLYVGAHHQLGVITQATLKVAVQKPEETAWLYTLEAPVDKPGSLIPLLQTLLSGQAPWREQLDQLVLFDSPSASLWQLWLHASGTGAAMETARNDLPGELLKQAAERELTLIGHKAPPTQLASLGKKLLQHHHHPLALSVCSHPRQTLSLWPSVQTILTTQAPGGYGQVHPQSGMLLWSWPEDALPSPEALDAAVQAIQQSLQPEQLAIPANGFCRIPVYPVAYTPLAMAVNLPADPVLRQVNRRLKISYDPGNVLISRGLPLERL
ncbi:MAG: FAD-binding oxidoreductase [Candidatus Melainabacteria bacterium]